MTQEPARWFDRKMKGRKIWLTREGSAYFFCPYLSANLLHATAQAELEPKGLTSSSTSALRLEGLIVYVRHRLAAGGYENLERVLLGGLHAFGDFVPVDQVPEGGDVVRSAILILEVVGVFPDVKTEQRRAANSGDGFAHQRAILVGGGTDGQLAAFDDQPSPTTTETGGGGVVEDFLQLIKAAEGAIDSRSQFACRCAAATRADDSPEQRVVGMTTTVIAHHAAFVFGHRGQVGN